MYLPLSLGTVCLILRCRVNWGLIRAKGRLQHGADTQGSFLGRLCPFARDPNDRHIDDGV